jgi:hypothetical protein
LSSLCP